MSKNWFWTLFFGLAAPVALHADGFVAFDIRGTPITTINGSQTEFVIDNGGDKAALGSNDINGQTIGSLASLTITRFDDPTRFAAGSGPAVAPYFNLWITDGIGNFAVVANEPSNPEFQGLFSYDPVSTTYTYDLSFADLASKSAKIYENNDKSWLPNNGVGLTFADLASFMILAPTSAQLGIGWAGLGTGAPRELGTNMAYGVNWVFGDTLSNYVSGDTGYIVGNASVRATSAVPDATSSLPLAGLAIVGLLVMKRRMRGSH